MRISRYLAGTFAALVLSGMFVSCKPTEKGYRAAYDAAVKKREAADADAMLPASGLQSDDGPQLRIIGGDSCYVMREQISVSDGKSAGYPWYVAVGVYKMNTNARANAQTLREQGYGEADAFRISGDRWVTVAAGAPTLDSVRVKALEFQRRQKDYPYIGFPKRPVLLNIL